MTLVPLELEIEIYWKKEKCIFREEKDTLRSANDNYFILRQN
jgi:hypothetical protein